jgi:hypothetical protein
LRLSHPEWSSGRSQHPSQAGPFHKLSFPKSVPTAI